MLLDSPQCRLYDKYRPTEIDQMVVSPHTRIKMVQKFLANPYPCAWLISGQSGVGKTSLARIMANKLARHPVAIGQRAGNDVDLHAVREMEAECATPSIFGGFKVEIVDEADAISEGAAIRLLPLGAAIYKQSREDRTGRAKFGYELIDMIFDDDSVRGLLDELDYADEIPSLSKALESIEDDPTAGDFKILDAFDTLLLYLDRIEHAIKSELTDFDAVQMPLAYYVNILAYEKSRISRYVAGTGYKRVLDFLNRFDEWTGADR